MTRYRITVPGDDELYHSRGPWKNHRYSSKIKLPSGKFRYIYGRLTPQSGGGGKDSTDYWTEGKKRANKFFNDVGKSARGIGRSTKKAVDDAGRYVNSTGRKIANSYAYKSAKRTAKSFGKDVAEAAKRQASVQYNARKRQLKDIDNLAKGAKKLVNNSLPAQLGRANKQRKEAEARARKAEERLNQKRRLKANQEARKRSEAMEAERKRRERARIVNEQHRQAQQAARERQVERERQRARTEEMRGKGNNLGTSAYVNKVNDQLTRDDMRRNLPDGYRITDEYVRNGRSIPSKKVQKAVSSGVSKPERRVRNRIAAKNARKYARNHGR